MKFKSLSFVTIFALSVFLIFSVSLDSQSIKKIDKLKSMKIESVKKPNLFQAQIGMIQQDVGPVHIIEVNGQNLGEPQGTRKIFLGGVEGEVRSWYNNFIELKFPDSPILGKKIPFLIKMGNLTISNTVQKSLRAYLEDCTPSSIKLGNLKGALVTLNALWCGTDKNNIKIRFMKKKLIVSTPKVGGSTYFGIIKSIKRSGSYMAIKVLLPSKITAGTYRVHIMQGRRVVSDGDPVFLTVRPFHSIR